jgi:hypothetical protein
MPTWTNNPATTSTHVRAVHINEVRGAVNSRRSAVGLATVTWTDDPSVMTTTHIRAVHFTELRSAIQDLWTHQGMGALPGWSAGSAPAPGTRQIKASDINDLRTWLDQYSAAAGTATGADPFQGVTSFSYDPTTYQPGVTGTAPSIVDDFWVADVVALRNPANDPFMLRTKVIADPNNNNQVSYPDYQTAFGRYTYQDFDNYAVLTSEFDPLVMVDGNKVTVNDQLTNGTNGYINDFSLRAEDFASNLKDSGLYSYFIWNEPNNSNSSDYIPQSNAINYVALLYQTYTRIGSRVPNGFLYMGGLLWPRSATVNSDAATTQVHDYLQAIYEQLQTLKNQGFIPSWYFPWDAVNVHIHHCGFTDQDMANLRQMIDGLKSAYGDPTPEVVVGEWGVTHDEAAQPGCLLSAYAAIRNHFDRMWYFQHPNIADPNANPPDLSCGATGDSFGLTEWGFTPPPPGSVNQHFKVTNHCPSWQDMKNAIANPNRPA